MSAVLVDPKMKARVADIGGTPFVLSPADFGKLIAEDTAAGIFRNFRSANSTGREDRYVSKPVRLRASTSRLQFPRELTL
jgi:hypothetical protein